LEDGSSGVRVVESGLDLERAIITMINAGMAECASCPSNIPR
jgi:hypothetical protein